jgi:sugar lactone lactonase YvrE
MVGMALDQKENLYVALASFVPQVQTGIYRVPPGGGQAALFASDKAMALPNGLAFGKKGDLFFTDSFAGAVFRVAPDGKVSKWVEHPLLKGDRNFCPPVELPFDVGANGLAFDNRGDLFLVNTHGATVVRVPVNRDGSAGIPEVYAGPDCATLKGADGLAIDSKGNLYVVDFLIHKLVRVSKDKKVTVLDSGGSLDSPASLAFGVRDDAKVLYMTNFAFLSAQGGGTPRPGVLRKGIDIKGIPLP